MNEPDDNCFDAESGKWDKAAFRKNWRSQRGSQLSKAQAVPTECGIAGGGAEDFVCRIERSRNYQDFFVRAPCR